MNAAEADTPLPCASSRGSPVALSISTPVTTYSLPGMRFSYVTVSTMTADSPATRFLSPSAPSTALVRIIGKKIDWFASAMSSCTATTFPSESESVSVNTVVLPESSLASISKATSTVPSPSSGVNATSWT